MSLWSDQNLRRLFLEDTPLIDVRAPVEFSAGAIPNSINLPILNDEERHLIGTCYKEQGQEAAIVLGHQLVSGDVKEKRVQAWTDAIKEKPHTQVFCFRGGLRSQISCSWITEAGIARTPIKGGYKLMRQFFLSGLTEAPLPSITRLAGLTGSGKTRLLTTLPHHIDIEELAFHRGSAFGVRGEQPAQVTFENNLALGLLKNAAYAIVEDESMMLGKISIPPRLYKTMIGSPMIVLKVGLDERIQNIFDDYVLPMNEDFIISSLQKISRQLGSTRTAALTQEIRDAFEAGKDLSRHRGWIETLLVDYYDHYYQRSIKKQSHLVRFEGQASDIREFLKHSTV